MNTSTNKPITLDPESSPSKGEEYNFLKMEGTTLLQALASDIWTDYNEHDPGVTTLEQLCYAITDLSYRANFSVADILSDKKNKINNRRHGLYTPLRIFPCNPVTENDYRKLIIDRIPDVKNVWLKPFIRNKCHPSRNVNGLYHIYLYVPDDVMQSHEDHSDFTRHIQRRALRLYSRHRGLCEDVQKISVLRAEPLLVKQASIVIQANTPPEKALAEAIFAIQQEVSPEIPRHSLLQKKNQGENTGEIFNGPLLHNGFISNVDLTEQPVNIQVRDIVGSIVQSNTILNIDNLALEANGDTYYEPDCINALHNAILQVDTAQALSTIKLFRQGMEVKANQNATLKELAQLWRTKRQTYPLNDQYRELYPIPQGKNRNLKQYYSIQNQYPNVYGINDFGLPEESSNMRQAKAKQFKGYLLGFEQLLSNFFSQLAHIKDLYSINRKQVQTYFFQFLNTSVPNVEPLLNQALYYEGLKDIVQNPSTNIERRNKFLDLLLALYGEELSPDSIWFTQSNSHCQDNKQENLIVAKLTFLHWLVISTHNRGKGFNYLRYPSRYNIAGMQIKSRIQLGMELFGHGSLKQSLKDSSFSLDDSSLSLEAIDSSSVNIEDEFSGCSLGDADPISIDESIRTNAFSKIKTLCDRDGSLSEELILSLGEINNYRIGSFEEVEELSIVIKLSDSGKWYLLDDHQTHLTARLFIQACIDIIAPIYHHCQQLYIIEHNLLRFGRSRRHDPHGVCGEDQLDEYDLYHPLYPCHHNFDYNFTITAVISTYRRNRISPDYRRFVEQVIRRNTPSHIAIKYCYLRPWQFCYFEDLYYSWRDALNDRKDKRAIIKRSARLRDFLIRHQNRK